MIKKILQNYLKFWAKKYLARAKPQIVAITGSVGKTTTKEAIFAVLAEKYKNDVAKSTGNLNSETGVPLAILGYKKSPKKLYEWIPVIFTAPFLSYTQKIFKIMILEFAADKPGDIKYLSSIANPDIAVITAIGPSHLANFESMEKVAQEKLSLLWSLKSSGQAVLNTDDEILKKASYGGRFEKITYAIGSEADITASNISTVVNGVGVTTNFLISGKVSADIVLSVLGGKAVVYASLAAASVGKILAVNDVDIKTGLEKVAPESHRMQIFRGVNNSIIIDDSYNANPLSMKNALNVLAGLKAKRKIAVLGEMREIGSISDAVHKEIGEIAAKSADLVVAIGSQAKKFNAQKYFTTKEEATKYLLKEVRENDIILVKASRSIGLDEIVESLKLN